MTYSSRRTLTSRLLHGMSRRVLATAAAASMLLIKNVSQSLNRGRKFAARVKPATNDNTLVTYQLLKTGGAYPSLAWMQVQKQQ